MYARSAADSSLPVLMLFSTGSELFGSELGLIKAQPVQPNDVFLISRHIRVVLRGPGVYAAL
jgi:hypothetical protein